MFWLVGFRKRIYMDDRSGWIIFFLLIIKPKNGMGLPKLSESTFRTQGSVNSVKKINLTVHSLQLSVLKSTGIK